MSEKKRSAPQNNRMWAMLTDISRQVKWPVNGAMQTITPEDWKHVLSAGIWKDSRIAEGVNGGFVILGQHTSKMTVCQMKELMDFMEWFGAEKGVKFTAPDIYSEYAA